MIVKVKMHPGSSLERIVKISEREFEIWTCEKAIDGRANLALIKILAKEFGVSQKNVLIKNSAARKKIVEIIN